MKTVFIFHGTGGYPQENWFPWLKKELEKLGCNVVVPTFSTPEGQTLENWFAVLDKYKEDIDENTIFVGHSLGGVFLLRLLEKHSAKAAFFVASPVGVLPIKNIETDKPFLEGGFDWEKINSHCKDFFVFHSDDDPYVCLENGEILARKLSTDLFFVRSAGHFNTAAGYTKFSLLLEKVKKVL
jgi:uncharacterized protein